MDSLQTTSAVFHLVAPSDDDAARAANAGIAAPFSYTEIGASAGSLPAGFDHDVQREVIGRGESDFRRAVDAIRSWTQFDLPWVRFYRRDTPLQPGAIVVFASWQLGVWALNRCRVVEVVDETDAAKPRFGFAYGTLEGHTVAGEERFLVTYDRATDEVSFEIRKFSALRHWIVRLGRPFARAVQARFSREAIARVRAFVRDGDGAPDRGAAA